MASSERRTLTGSWCQSNVEDFGRVRQFRTFLIRQLRRFSIAWSSSAVWIERSLFLGGYSQSRPLVFSLDPAGAENPVRAAQEAFRCSCRSPPSRSCRWTFRYVSAAGSVIGSGSGRRGRTFAIPRWGRCRLWWCSYSHRAWSRCVWFQVSVRSSSSWRQAWI
jgi:hypothetical protein